MAAAETPEDCAAGVAASDAGSVVFAPNGDLLSVLSSVGVDVHTIQEAKDAIEDASAVHEDTSQVLLEPDVITKAKALLRYSRSEGGSITGSALYDVVRVCVVYSVEDLLAVLGSPAPFKELGLQHLDEASRKWMVGDFAMVLIRRADAGSGDLTTQGLDGFVRTHFKDALATLPDPDKEQVKKAFHRLDGANANPTAVSSAKWAFIRAELRVASTVVALVQPEVLKALHAAVVGPAEDVAAVERLAGLMAGIMVETPAALLGKIEQGWTQAPEGVSEGAWTELLEDQVRPALQREQFSAAVGRMTAEGEEDMPRALRPLSAVDRERVEEVLEKLGAENANVAAVACAKCAIARRGADLDVESVVAVLQKGVLDAAYKALVESVEDVAALERLLEFLDRWTRTKATRLVSEGRTTRRLKPEGVREEVWSELLKNYLFPALRHAVFEGAVAYMAEDGEWRFMAAVRRLPKRDRKRVRDAFARLDAADVDKSALTCVKWAFTSATGEVDVASLLSELSDRGFRSTKRLLRSSNGDFAALQKLVTGLQSSIAPGSASHAAERWPPIHRGARPRRDGTREEAAQVPLLELHKVCNVGIPLHHLLVSGKDSIRGLATAPPRVHRAYEDAAVALEDRDSCDIKDSFVWLRNLFGNFIPGDVCEWQVLRVLRNPAELSSASPGDGGMPWSLGCRPVLVNGVLAAVVLWLPAVDGMPFGLDKSNVQCFEPPFEVPVIPLGYGSGSGAAAGQVMQQRLGFTEFVLTPQRAEFFARAFATCMGKDQGVLATSGEGTGKTECLRAIATIVTIGLGGDAFVLPSAWRASRSSEAEGVTEALLHGLFSLSGGGALADERISSVLLGAGEGYLEDDAVQAILSLQTGFFGRPREGQLHPTPRLLLVDDAHELHGDYLQHKEAASAARRRSLDSLFLWDSTSCKVLAYKPDVRSFEFPDEEDRGSTFSFAFDAGSENPVVDLGTFSNPLAEHLLFLEDQQPGEGAANAAAGAGATCSTQHAMQATVACMALPENVRVLVGGSDDFKGKLTQLVARVGGEPRVLLRLVAALKTCEHSDAEKAFKVASELVADIIKERSRSLKRHLVEWLGSQAGGDARLPLKNLLQLVADATAPSPQFPYLRGFSESPFRGSDLAFGVATHAMLSLSGEVSCGASQDHLDDMWAGKVVEGNAPIVADLFESQVGVLLYMGLFGGLYVNLTGQAEELDLHEAWASGSFFEGMQAAALSERILERLGSTKDSSGINQEHITMLHELKVNQVLLIHTQRNFPGVDFLAFKWVKRGERMVLQVAFVEATTSTLIVHSSHRSLKFVLTGSVGSAGGQVNVPGALKDIVKLVATGGWKAPGPSGIPHNREGAATEGGAARPLGPATLASTIFSMLGIPIIVDGVWKEGQGSHSLDVQLHQAEVPDRTGAAEASHSSETFSVSTVTPEDVELCFVYCSARSEAQQNLNTEVWGRCNATCFGLFGSGCIADLRSVLASAAQGGREAEQDSSASSSS